MARIRGWFNRLLPAVLLSVAASGAAPPTAEAGSATIAAAANFALPLRTLESDFESATGHEIEVVSAATGQLYAQIVSGAPFDVLLGADQVRPALLAEEERGESASLFTYAVGRLALWTRDPELMAGLSVETLRTGDYRWLAIANPEFAPYGAAARDVLESLGIWVDLQARIVRGQSIAQAFAMAETRNANLGLIALSQALDYERTAAYVVVPQDLHGPICQDAILLNRAQHNEAARAFLEYLKSAEAKAVIERFGYAIDD
jgi:molybdate transport system substrate-binding protein